MMRLPETFEAFADILCCPKCGGTLCVHGGHIGCQTCETRFDIIDNIPALFAKHEGGPEKADVTDKVRAFYEENPFPNYDNLDDVTHLVEKARQGVFAKMLDEQIPFGARVLECGCGTGQLSIFLSLAQRTVFGVDMSASSLRLGQFFKERHNLTRVHFFQMNLFAPIFRPQSFDIVISNGVLHHTADPFLAYHTIANLVKPRGHLLIGLYHKYGRLFHDVRRLLFRVSRNRFAFLDPRLRNNAISQGRRDTWFADQYRNPHESRHTIGEVLRWFRRTGFQFVKSIPRSVPGAPFGPNEQLFSPERPGTLVERFCVEFPLAFTGSKEGGFFLMIARKHE